MILTLSEIRLLESKTIESGVTAETLMDEAGGRIFSAIQEFFPRPGLCRVYYGKGNNGGDALVAARHLADAGWRIELRSKFYDQELGVLPRRKLQILKGLGLGLPSRKAHRGHPLVILDGLLGVGVQGELRDPVRAAAREINRSRQTEDAYVVSVDLPSGMATDTGEWSEDCVVADFTMAIGYAKRGHVADCATNHVGRLVVLPLQPFDERVGELEDPSLIASTATLKELLPRRAFDSHKTNFGRVGIVAGSRGFTGAAVMSTSAALRAGAGLVTLYACETIYPILATAVPPEVMVRPVESLREVTDQPHDVLAVGPGLGREHDEEVLELVQHAAMPMVVDADGLNALSTDIGILNSCAGPRLLTPHPGEMARLQETAGRTRLQIVDAFTSAFPTTVLLLKGARTIIGQHGVPYSYNTTGSPGMGTGGMGDILTGVCAALVGQGLKVYDAARLGAWLCGRAAELALFGDSCSEESLVATDLLGCMGKAFDRLREGGH